MILRVRPPRRVLAAAIVIVMAIEASGCARQSESRRVVAPVDDLEGRDGSQGGGEAIDGQLVTRPNPPIFVDERAAREASRRTAPSTAQESERRILLDSLHARVAAARRADGAAREMALLEVAHDTLQQMRHDEALFDIHPQHARWRTNFSRILVTVANARAEGDDSAEPIIAPRTGRSALERRCPVALSGTNDVTTPVDTGSMAASSEHAGEHDRSTIDASEHVEGTMEGLVKLRHQRACRAFLGGQHALAADTWLSMLFVPGARSASIDESFRDDLYLLHEFARWLQYAETRDVEALVTSRALLRIRLFEDESLHDGSARGARELAGTISAMNELDEVLLGTRQKYWQAFAMEAERVVAKARKRARATVAGGIVLIVFGSLTIAGAVPILFFLAVAAGWISLAMPIAGLVGMGLVIGGGVVLRWQGRRVLRRLASQRWSTEGPDHWFQPGVGRRLRDPTGLFVIEAAADRAFERREVATSKSTE